MHVRLQKTIEFQSAHWLPTFPQGHKCRRMHGHSFYADLFVEGEVDQAKGYLMDFGDIMKAVNPVRDRLDHYLLNDVPGLENPTAENIARWIYDQLKPALPLLVEVKVRETCTSAAIYRGPAPLSPRD